MALYTDKTFAQMKDDVAGRLDDPLFVFFTSPEVGFAINEAIKIFGLLTGYWREQVSFLVSPNLPQAQTLTPTLTDIELITEILYHMIEVPNWPYAGTDMFVQSDFLTPLQRRRDQFLAESGLYLSIAAIADTFITTSTFALPEAILSIERLAWVTPTPKVRSNLWPTSQYDLNSLTIDAGPTPPPAPPFAYALNLQSTLTAEFAPVISSVPVGSGIDIIGALAGGSIDGSGLVIGIPNDFCWILKYGHMADLLNSDGQARDENRAKYCQMRYEQGLEIAKVYKKVFRVRVNGSQFQPLTLNDLDGQLPGWQNQVGTPQFMAYAGGLLFTTPIPSSLTSITIDRYMDAPVLVNDADILQLDKSYYDAIIDYAVHCSTFKMAGAEFTRTMDLLQDFMSLAGEDKPWSQFDYRKLQPFDINNRSNPPQQKEAA